jgi:hypothetical protein
MRKFVTSHKLEAFTQAPNSLVKIEARPARSMQTELLFFKVPPSSKNINEKKKK